MLSNVILALIVIWAAYFAYRKAKNFFAQASSDKEFKCSCSGCPGGCGMIKK